MTDPRYIPLAISLEFPGQNVDGSRLYHSLICDPNGAGWVAVGDPVTGDPIATTGIPSVVTSGSRALVTASGVYAKALQADDNELQVVDSINLDSSDPDFSLGEFVGLGCASVPLLTDGDAFLPARAIPPDGNIISRDSNATCQVTASIGYAYDQFAQSWLTLVSATAETMAPSGGASGHGALIVSEPGEWTITHAPVAATVATATRAAGLAGTRHVLTSFCADLNAVAAQPAPLTFVVRDGASGVGAILYQRRLNALAGATASIEMVGLHIVGSDATAMTVEVTAAPAATNFATVSASGFSLLTSL